ncbi:DMT family transporter [Lonsdalea britannica]|uniref:DMT family transporter n=1 Tax=Lonsdalea britannica TaxID=1082704 RepID=UPI0026EFFCCC|nr:DMT family transporter [Lonsdalea britannica]
MSQSPSAVDQPSRLIVFFILTLPPLLWAGNFIIGRAVRNEIPPVTLTLVRWLIALICILPFALKYIRRDAARYRAFPLRIVAISLSGIVAFSLLTYIGLHHTSGTNALLLNSCIPVLIMLFAGLFYGQPLRLSQATGLLISFCGVLAIIFHGDLAGLLSLSFSSGDLMLLGAMASFSLYTLWLKKIPPEVSRLGLLGVQVIISLIAIFPLWLWESRSGASAVWNHTTVSAVLYLGIFPSFIAYLLFGRGVALIGAARAGLTIHLIPVFGVALSVLFLGEKIHFYHLAGIATILAGISLASRKSVTR